MIRVSFRLAALLAVILMLTPAVARAAPATPEATDKEVSPAEKVKKQLDQAITVEVTDQSLNAALNQIREQAKINFVVDRFTIQQMGMDPEQMLVSIKLKDVKARTCLRSVLAPYNLGYAIIGDTVLIGTDDMAMHRQLKQRVSIDLEKVDLAAALKKLSRETATNLLLDSRVPAKEARTEVTLQMEDVPLETAVRLMAETAGLKPVKVGNVFLVTTKALANEMRQDPDLQQQQQQPPPMPGQAIPFNQVMQQGLILNGWNGQVLQGNVNGIWGQGVNNIDIIQPVMKVPPLEKPAEKTDSPGEDEKPAAPEKKPDPPKSLPK